MSASYRFLPWVRQGAAGAIRQRDTLGAGVPGRAQMRVQLRINQRSDADVGVAVHLHGPGDVTGIDQRQVVRTDPPHLANDFEPNYFPLVEFDAPDLPWLFTPAAGDPQERLRPWICLIVVRKQDGVSLRVEPRKPLPVLRIAAPAVADQELPDLAESWAWAHAQVVSGNDEKAMSDLLASDSPLNLSRLICPRRLEPAQRYLACVVPAFAAGRKAGLGLPLAPEEEQELQPAWQAGAAEVVLPVYYHWEFGTGLAGDFESLVRLLRARPLPEGVGVRQMAVDDLPFDLPGLGALDLEGALRPAEFEAGEPQSFAAFQSALRTILNLPQTLLAGSDREPLVAPPIYGRWQTARTAIADGEQEPVWLRELNLDPRARAVAGFGTLIVQDQQEQLMAAAWQQLGDRRANAVLRQSQLAREVASAIFAKRLKPLQQISPDRLLQFTAPVHARIRLSPHTLLHEVRGSSLPERTLSASFRRIVRPGGPVVRRMAPALRRQTLPMVKNLAAGQIKPLRPTRPPTVMASAQILKPRARLASPTLARFRQAADALQDYLADTQRLAAAPKPKPLTAKSLASLQTKLLTRLDPTATVTRRVEAQLTRSDVPRSAKDPLAPFTTAPQFLRPMYETLRDLSQELLLPGLERVPPNTVALLETNTRFVESFMVGLNHEMSRELLWREYPTDQRETYFRRFWDDTGTAPASTTAQLDPIHLWAPERRLGENFKTADADEHLVLLVRGELLQRYPTAVISAVKAARRADGSGRTLASQEKFPLFQGTLEPDVSFFGFALTAEEALGAQDEAGRPAAQGDPGWFFVIQQQPTEPRFGLDVATPAEFGRKPQTAWNQLSWAHLVENAQALTALTHAPIAGRLRGHKVGAVEWGFNPAHMAAATLQRPVRIAIHASALLGE